MLIKENKTKKNKEIENFPLPHLVDTAIPSLG